MNASILLWLVGVIAAGVALLVWGLRGKRLNDHPVCRQCRFDLSGQPDGTVTCPECGAGLKREGSIRRGQRRKRPLVMTLGSLAILLPVLAIGTIVFAIVTGTDLNSYKPLGLLEWEAERANAARSKLIGSELHKRIMVKGIPKDRYDRIVQAALDYQGNAGRPWSVEWGDIIEQADTDGKLSKEDKSRYRRQAAVLTFEARPRVRLGDDIPVVAKLSEKRIGTAAMMMALSQMDGATVDGAKARMKASGSAWGGAQMGWFYLYGPRAGWGWGASDGGCIGTMLSLPYETGEGRSTVKVSIGLMTIDQPTSTGYSWPSTIKRNDLNTKFHEATFTVDILPKDALPVEVVTPSEDVGKKLEQMLEPTNCRIFGGQQVMMQFNVDSSPMDFAFDVVIKSAGREWTLASVTSGTQADTVLYPAPGGANARQLHGMAVGFKGGKADVVLRPSTKAALRTTDITRIYGKEIVFEGVEFQQQGHGIRGSGSTIMGDLIRGLLGG
jgi:hypothetical protein